jgi:hypothetical protein
MEGTMPHDFDEEVSLARAFSLGSDARIAGKHISENPYRLIELHREADYWRKGWWHVSQNWPRHVPLAKVEGL